MIFLIKCKVSLRVVSTTIYLTNIIENYFCVKKHQLYYYTAITPLRDFFSYQRIIHSLK